MTRLGPIVGTAKSSHLCLAISLLARTAHHYEGDCSQPQCEPFPVPPPMFHAEQEQWLSTQAGKSNTPVSEKQSWCTVMHIDNYWSDSNIRCRVFEWLALKAWALTAGWWYVIVDTFNIHFDACIVSSHLGGCCSVCTSSNEESKNWEMHCWLVGVGMYLVNMPLNRVWGHLYLCKQFTDVSYYRTQQRQWKKPHTRKRPFPAKSPRAEMEDFLYNLLNWKGLQL